MPEDNKPAESKFNTGLFKMGRINDVMKEINLLNLNPLGRDERGVEKANFEFLFKCYNIIFMECYANLSDTERNEGDDLSNQIQEQMENFSVYKIIRRDISSNKRIIIYNHENWKMLQQLLQKYERFIRICLKKTNMDTPEKQKTMF